MKLYLFFLILIFPATFFLSQTTVSGNVYNENQVPLSGVLVVNIDNDLKSITDENGHFVINANAGNELRFVRQNYERASAIVNSNSYFFGINTKMIFAPTDIEEVIVSRKLSGNLANDSKLLTKVDKIAQLNSDIGLPKSPEKPREKPADLKKSVLLPILFGQVNFQSIYDLASGKARRQKRLYRYEDFQEKIEWLKSNLRSDFFRENSINKSQTSDFLSFGLLESNALNNSFKAKNIDKAEFILLGFVKQYLERKSQN
ncbi:MAG: carboxypeptidase regulatory-like domain-containing protein [Chryseobacterium sp.]|nr:carboxypeptidase regulatory-like domain-containing protein [Chryseobacterium sp.]